MYGIFYRFDDMPQYVCATRELATTHAARVGQTYRRLTDAEMRHPSIAAQAADERRAHRAARKGESK